MTVNKKNGATFASDPEAALATYRQTGYHIEPKMWTAAQCRKFIDMSRRLPSFKNKTYKMVLQVHRIDPSFLVGLCNPKIVKIMEFLVGGSVGGIQTQFFFGPPGTPGFNAHQDNDFVRAKADAFASAWSALEDVSANNGGLVVWPGTHLFPVLPTKPVGDESGSLRQDGISTEVDIPAGFKPVNIRVPMGSTVFIHANLIHGSNPNKTKNQFRHVLLCTYVRRGESFRPGFHAKRAQIDVYNRSQDTMGF